MKGLKNISIICLLLLVAIQNGMAQANRVEKALELFSAKKLDSAKVIIDQAIQNPESVKDYQAWMVRGFIYKDLD